VLENVTVVDEISDVHSSEIETDLDAGVGAGSAPIRHVDRINVLSLIGGNRSSIPLQRQEMELMHVELVVLLAAVLDRPVLYGALLGNERRGVAGIE